MEWRKFWSIYSRNDQALSAEGVDGEGEGRFVRGSTCLTESHGT